MATIQTEAPRAADGRHDVIGVMFSHFGIYCAELEPMEAFYTRVLGFAVSDRGIAGRTGVDMSFMTRRPREHHQFVLGEKREKGIPSTINQVGFKAPSLDELRRIRSLLENEPGASDITAVDHGISWSLYFYDPERNRCVISVETGFYVPQPAAWPLDLSLSDDQIRRETEDRCRGTRGFMTFTDWSAERRAALLASGQLTTEGIPTGDPHPGFDAPFEPGRKLFTYSESAAEVPRIAMSHVGFYAIDLDALTRFYTETLGYAINGKGRMPAIGPHPEAEYVYLSRDPMEHQQVILCEGRAASTPTSIDQLSLRVPSLKELRKIEKVLKTHPGVHDIEYVCHGNSFSIYFRDPEGNRIELAVESVWYVHAPSGWFLDLSLDDDALIKDTENKVRECPGFLMRADWKARARDELIEIGRLEAEGLVRDVA